MLEETGIAISIVVPVYNAEKYLEQSIESLLNQTFQDYELIFVDDGSTDHSLEILEQYQAKDSRIKIIKQKNQYAGVARNNGMKAATGKYLMFLDADDFFEPNMLEKLYCVAEKHQVELVIFGHYVFDELTQSVTHKILPSADEGMVFCPKDLKEKLFYFCWSVPWNKLLLRSFVLDTGLEYQTLKSSNDEFFNKMILAEAKRAICLPEYYVYYRYNNADSLQGKRGGESTKDYQCMMQAIMKIKSELIARHLFEGSIRDSYYGVADFSISASLEHAKSEKTMTLLYDFLKENMIPGVFEDVNCIPIKGKAYRLYNSESLLQFLFDELKQTKNELEQVWKDYVPRDSKPFILGNAILTPIKWIKNVLK